MGQLLKRLPGIFTLYDIQGYEHSEIAKILGRSIGNSKSQLHKARKRLRELLQKAFSSKNMKSPNVRIVEAPNDNHMGDNAVTRRERKSERHSNLVSVHPT